MPLQCHLAFRALALAVSAGLALSGCVSLPTGDELRRAPSPHLAADAPAGVVDGRGRFRPLFCEFLEAYPEEPGTPVLVTGAFSECFGDEALPFGSALPNLRDSGISIDTIVVGGRSGTEHNAREIAEYLDTLPVRPEAPLVLVGYSKGTSDILQFLVDFPDAARQVDAVVSVAGSVGGSPLADEYDGLYEFLFSHLPSGHCPPGDGDVVHSLRTEIRRTWVRDNELPGYVDYYSIAAFTTRDRVARALVPSWKTLLKQDRRNDGQLLARDALIPGSTLLGYVHADHWAVALDIEDDSPLLAHRGLDAQFPHLALLRAILQQVAIDMASKAGEPRE